MGKKGISSRVRKSIAGDPNNKFLYSTQSLAGHLWVGPTCESLVSYSVISKI